MCLGTVVAQVPVYCNILLYYDGIWRCFVAQLILFCLRLLHLACLIQIKYLSRLACVVARSQVSMLLHGMKKAV